jgi:hypothetical protein
MIFFGIHPEISQISLFGLKKFSKIFLLQLVPGTNYVFKIFFWMIVPGTNCSKKIFENFFGPKKGDLVPG